MMIILLLGLISVIIIAFVGNSIFIVVMIIISLFGILNLMASLALGAHHFGH